MKQLATKFVATVSAEIKSGKTILEKVNTEPVNKIAEQTDLAIKFLMTNF